MSLPLPAIIVTLSLLASTAAGAFGWLSIISMWMPS